jgi:hypothetical protein
MYHKILKCFFYDVRCAVFVHYYIMLILYYADMLQNVWNELDYLVDGCRITKGANIEHL